MARPPSYEKLDPSSRIADIEPWTILCGFCTRCGHLSDLNTDAVARIIGHYEPLNAHKSKLRCKACSAKGHGEFVAYRLPR